VSANQEPGGKRVSKLRIRIRPQATVQEKLRSSSLSRGTRKIRRMNKETCRSKPRNRRGRMQGMSCNYSPGQIPWSLNGMSSWFTINPQTPFCPCLLENLSPNSGLRVCLISTFIKVWSLSVSVIMTLSMFPAMGDLYVIGEFLYDTAEACPVKELSLAFAGICLLMYTSPGSTRSPTPARPSGWMTSYFL